MPDAGEPDASDPTGGEQGDVCDEGADCKDDLGCFNPGEEGRGVCSIDCVQDEQCEDIPGADWTCSMTNGLCQVECVGEDDDDSCPAGLICVKTISVGGGGGGGFDAFRCKHPGDGDPDPTPGTQGPYDACEHSEECVDGLFCHVPGGFSTGYCTQQCSPENEDPCGDISVPGE
jgi:hypothetical protein